MEMNSVPEEIDELNRKIRQLEIEREAIKRDGKTVRTETIDKQLADFIEEYEDATFWEELTYRLADRDIDRQLNGKTPKNVEEQIALFTKAQIKYEEEFEKNDLENLEIVKGAKAPSKKAITTAKKPAAKSAAKKPAKPAPKGKKA